MESTHSLDRAFSSALQSTLDRPGKLEEVLQYQSPDGAASHTYDTLRVVIERTVRASLRI